MPRQRWLQLLHLDASDALENTNDPKRETLHPNPLRAEALGFRLTVTGAGRWM